MNTRRGLRRLGAVGAALAFFLVMGAWKGLQYRDVLHVEYRGGEIESFYLEPGEIRTPGEIPSPTASRGTAVSRL